MEPEKKTSRWPLRRIAVQIVAAVFFALAGWVVYDRARSLDWSDVARSLSLYEPDTVMVAVGFVVAAYLVFASFDLLAKRYVHHGIPAHKTLAIAFVSYAFNVNLGTWIGGMGFRYRLYSRYGLKPRQITQVIGLGILTNWSGYVLLAGLLFSFAPPALPADWDVSENVLRGVGALLLVGVGLYLGLCASGRGSAWNFRGVKLAPPPLSMALVQIALSTMSWGFMATIVNHFLPPEVEFETALATLLLGAIAGVIAHIPAGLGVLEAVFMAMLGDHLPPSQIVAALLAYRAVYYLFPFTVAACLYGALEYHARHGHPGAPPRSSAPVPPPRADLALGPIKGAGDRSRLAREQA